MTPGWNTGILTLLFKFPIVGVLIFSLLILIPAFTAGRFKGQLLLDATKVFILYTKQVAMRNKFSCKGVQLNTHS